MPLRHGEFAIILVSQSELGQPQSEFMVSYVVHDVCDLACVQAWGAMESLETLLVDHNMLSGYLPASYARMHDLRILSVGKELLLLS